ncbi:MAG: hypothetical protein V2A78_06585 [bacterium]
MLKKFLLAAFLLILLSSVLDAKETDVYIRSKYVSENPLVVEGNFCLTIDALMKPLQKEMSVDSASGNVVIDGKVTAIRPIERESKVYIPLKPLAEYLGMKLMYKAETGILDLYYEKLASEVRGADPDSLAAGGYAALGIKAEEKDKIVQTLENYYDLQQAALKFLKMRFGITVARPPRLEKSERNDYRAWPQADKIDMKLPGEGRDNALMILIHEHTHIWMYQNSSWAYRTCRVMEEAPAMWTAIKFAQFVGNKGIEPKRKDAFRYDIPEVGDAIELALQIENKYGEKGVIEFFKNPKKYPEGKGWVPTGYNN